MAAVITVVDGTGDESKGEKIRKRLLQDVNRAAFVYDWSKMCQGSVSGRINENSSKDM